MFYHISGGLTYFESGMAVIDCGGVGYKLTVSGTTQNTLPPYSEDNPPKVKLYTYLSVREDAMELFGFATESELSTFRMLISVSGVGPKAAMAILSIMTPEQFALAVVSEDTKAISRASGVGAKSAARIVLELKDKLGAASKSSSTAADTFVAATRGDSGSNKLSEAQNALIVLGYSRAEATSALRSIKAENMELEEIIRSTLMVLSKV